MGPAAFRSALAPRPWGWDARQRIFLSACPPCAVPSGCGTAGRRCARPGAARARAQPAGLVGHRLYAVRGLAGADEFQRQRGCSGRGGHAVNGIGERGGASSISNHRVMKRGSGSRSLSVARWWEQALARQSLTRVLPALWQPGAMSGSGTGLGPAAGGLQQLACGQGANSATNPMVCASDSQAAKPGMVDAAIAPRTPWRIAWNRSPSARRHSSVLVKLGSQTGCAAASRLPVALGAVAAQAVPA